MVLVHIMENSHGLYIKPCKIVFLKKKNGYAPVNEKFHEVNDVSTTNII
jgi:hypothetical protein